MSSPFEEEAKRIAALNKHKTMKTDSVGAAVAAAFLLVIGCLALLAGGWVYGVFAYGFVAAKIWGWFIVPILGLKALTWIQAAAVFLVVRFFTTNHNPKIDSNDERSTSDKIATVLVPLVSPWEILFFAWLFKVIFM